MNLTLDSLNNVDRPMNLTWMDGWGFVLCWDGEHVPPPSVMDQSAKSQAGYKLAGGMHHG